MARNKIEKEYILITSSNFPIGGAGANYLNLFCRGLIKEGYSISVWLLKGFAFGSHRINNLRKNMSPEGIPYVYLSSPQRSISKFYKIVDDVMSMIRLIFYLTALINKRNSILILLYNNELHFNIPIFAISKIIGIKIISFVPEFYDTTSFEGSLFRKLKWYGFLFNFNYLNKKSHRLIVFSHYLKDIYLKQGIDERNIIVQPNITDFDFWKAEKVEIKYTLGYSGTPSVKDGLFDLLQAISILNAEDVPVTLLIIGDSTFGKSLIPNLQKLCASLNISELVTFTGLVDMESVRKSLSECKILTLTRPNIIQTQAGFPTKLGEYFASGKQIMTTNFGDIEKYFIPMKDIVTAECGNIADISNKIKWMLDHPIESEKIQKAGYLKAKQVLSYNESVIRILVEV